MVGTARHSEPAVHIHQCTDEGFYVMAGSYGFELDGERIVASAGSHVLVPDGVDRRIVHDVMYDELCVGVIRNSSREEYGRIMLALAERGAEGILLGCTEIELLVGPEDAPVPVFDTTRLHVQKAVDLALA